MKCVALLVLTLTLTGCSSNQNYVMWTADGCAFVVTRASMTDSYGLWQLTDTYGGTIGRSRQEDKPGCPLHNNFGTKDNTP